MKISKKEILDLIDLCDNYMEQDAKFLRHDDWDFYLSKEEKIHSMKYIRYVQYMKRNLSKKLVVATSGKK